MSHNTDPARAEQFRDLAAEIMAVVEDAPIGRYQNVNARQVVDTGHITIRIDLSEE